MLGDGVNHISKLYELRTMSESSTQDWIQLVVTIMLGSGGVITGLGFLFDYLSKKRQELLDMARFRMEKISNRLEDYILFTHFSNWLAGSLSEVMVKPNLKDNRHFSIEQFYYYIGYLQTSRDVFVNRGGFALSDQDAENAILALHNTVRTTLKIYDVVNTSKVRQLIEKNASADDLERVLDDSYEADARTYFDEFVDWMFDANNSQQNRRAYAALRCITELMTFEINYTFEKWYNKKFTTRKHLSSEVRDFLWNEQLFFDSKLIEANEPYFRKIFEQSLD